MSSTTSTSNAPSTSNVASYSDHPPRITKEDLYMVLALWMQHFPVESKNDPKRQMLLYSGHRKVGAVLVLPNDTLYAVDCTRDDVHGVARLLMNHPDIAKGCKVFVSRKPCSFCTKLLVQSKVERVFFPPFEPEYHGVLKFTSKALEKFKFDILKKLSGPDEKENISAEDLKRLELHRPSVLSKFEIDGVLDNLATAVAKDSKVERNDAKLIESITNAAVKLALEEFEREKSQVDTLFTRSSVGQSVFVPKVDQPVLDDIVKRHGIENGNIDSKARILFAKFWKDEWIKTVESDLSWPIFDEKMKKQAKEDFESTMKWMVKVQVKLELDPIEINFEKVESSRSTDNKKTLDLERATHLITMAQFLAERTDDPKKGVGAVIATNEEKEIKALGWNGFPFKAINGDFPRASDDDDAVEQKKYPFIIHAEQNALLLRNDKKLGEDATLFVTKTPCDECTPLIQMQGIQTVVLGEQMKRKESEDLNYSKFPDKVEEGVFTCYEKKPRTMK